MQSIVGNVKTSQISNNQIITLNRGDTFSAPLFINRGTKVNPSRYSISEKDTIYVAILEANQKFENAIIKKVYTIDDVNEYGDVMVQLSSEDTEYLLPGTYYYQIKLEHIEDDETSIVDTIVPKRKLFLVE